MDKNKTKQFLIQALVANGGNVSDACKAAKIARLTYYRWRDEDAKFKASCDEINEVSIDNVETALYRQALEGNTTAIIFFLKTKGRQRGYSERIDHNLSAPNGSIKIEISDIPAENPEPTADEE